MTTASDAPHSQLPPASVPPYPAQAAPHPQRDEALAHPPAPPRPAKPTPSAPIGALGVTLIGGAVAVAVGFLFVSPLLHRGKKPKAKPTRHAPAKKARRTDRKARATAD